MKHAFPLAVVIALASSGAAVADDDCRSAMADWQPREAATAYVVGLGISPDRLRIDDRCYEVRGRDSDGNRIELKLDPATLTVMELSVEFRSGADPLRYLSGGLARADEFTPAAPRMPTDPTAQSGGN